MRRLGKTKFDEARITELRKLLNDWNPIGVSCPPDEYDSLLATLDSKLKKGCNREFLAQYLTDSLVNGFGLSIDNRQVLLFAGMLVAWHSKREH